MNFLDIVHVRQGLAAAAARGVLYVVVVKLLADCSAQLGFIKPGQPAGQHKQDGVIELCTAGRTWLEKYIVKRWKRSIYGYLMSASQPTDDVLTGRAIPELKGNVGKTRVGGNQHFTTIYTGVECRSNSESCE